MAPKSKSNDGSSIPSLSPMPTTRGYQQEMLDESLRTNIIIALDTGSGKTHIAVLRLKHEMEREPTKIAWFFAPTVALCEQQKDVIQTYLPVSVGLVSGANEPNQWKNAALWEKVLTTHGVMVSTPQVFLDALRHGYIRLGTHISLLVFDEAHHAVDNHPYNRIMMEFYFDLLPQDDPMAGNSVRPRILGLTASPIYGGNVVKAFATIEKNLDSTIRAPRRHRAELAQYVHRPVFRHVLYYSPEQPFFSTNLAALQHILTSLNIEEDPYVKSLREQLAKETKGTHPHQRIDQKLSKVIQKQDSFTHKGLRDFERAAADICSDMGPWAADWFIGRVLEKTKKAANPYDNLMVSWKSKEKSYLLSILDNLVVSPVSYFPGDIVEDSSDKVRVLVECLLAEKAEAESHNESYSGIIFVQRRDAVLALAEVLRNHPQTKDLFNVGILLGTSESAYRHAMMDITRSLVKQTQDDTLKDFKIGEKNLIVSTSVAEEGIDIQACGSVIRWDPPPNMASWAQSRGRARKKRSTFTVMFEDGSKQQGDVVKWAELERQMVKLYNDPSRDLAVGAVDDEMVTEEDDEEDDIAFAIPETGALLTLHSAVAHLAHFCAVIPNTSHVDNRPLYDVDPPEFPEGWHSFDGQFRGKQPYTGPYGSKVTLPRTLPLPERQFSVDVTYKTIISAHRHAAYKAYLALNDAGLLNDHLLPITSVLEPELEEDVKAMLEDVEKRAGMAKVSMSADPWAPAADEGGLMDYWFCSELTMEGGLPPLRLFTRAELTTLDKDTGGPVLHRAGHEPMQVTILPLTRIHNNDESIAKAREFTRRVFWSLNCTRMNWDDLDFAYLFLPSTEGGDSDMWDTRRAWLENYNADLEKPSPFHIMANASVFGKAFDYPSDLTFVQRHIGFGRPFKFVRWRYEPLSEDEEAELLGQYKRLDVELVITMPLLVVEAYPPRTNFLIPLANPLASSENDEPPKRFNLLPDRSAVFLLSREETEYALLLPSILRSISMSMTAHSLRETLFSSPDLSALGSIPIPLLMVAITAPMSCKRANYQRMETLGDTVLKFMAGLQILAEYPLWHEGYLTRKKDHAVSNVRLAKEDIKHGVYRWIIRDMMLGKKWKPKYFTVEPEPLKPEETPGPEDVVMDDVKGKKKKKAKGQTQQLSTKVLADVIESLIGAAYLHGGFDLGYECVKYFNLGLKWEPIRSRVDNLLSRVEVEVEECPALLASVERMLGYTFERKLLLIEALTHASYQQDSRTPSYERMEFLGDSVLDMVVTQELYHAPGKNYSPGHIHLRRSAVVNGHILAYVCLRTSLHCTAEMPRPGANGKIEVSLENKEIHLWKCLLHSSPRVLEDQLNTFTRFRKRQEEIENALTEGTIFPWAALTRLQAPKFLSDMVESIIGAISLDSHGDFNAVRRVLHNLGIMQILSHIIDADVDVLHPVSRLSLWAQKNGKEIEYTFPKDKGNISCVILVDGVEEVRESDQYRGMASQEEVKFAAAEQAIKAFRLRDVNVNHVLMKKVSKPRPKKKKPKSSD